VDILRRELVWSLKLVHSRCYLVFIEVFIFLWWKRNKLLLKVIVIGKIMRPFSCWVKDSITELFLLDL